MKGLKYMLRLLAGESPESIIKSMPLDDQNKVKEFARSIDTNRLNRAQRRKLAKLKP